MVTISDQGMFLGGSFQSLTSIDVSLESAPVLSVRSISRLGCALEGGVPTGFNVNEIASAPNTIRPRGLVLCIAMEMVHPMANQAPPGAARIVAILHLSLFGAFCCSRFLNEITRARPIAGPRHFMLVKESSSDDQRGLLRSSARGGLSTKIRRASAVKGQGSAARLMNRPTWLLLP